MAARERQLDLKAIGSRIRQLRGNILQENFAVQLGISQGQLSKIERGKMVPNLDTLVKVSQQFRKSVDWIIWGD